MRRTFALAGLSVDAGNHPFGALLVHSGQIVAEAQNTACTSDCTGHAELNLVKMVDHLEEAVKRSSTLYTSTEPCLMCAGAIYWAGIRKVVYSVPAERLFDHTNYGVRISCRELYERANEDLEMIGPVLENEGFSLHKDFWS